MPVVTSRCPSSPLVARHRPTPDNKVVRRGTFGSTQLSGDHHRDRRRDDRHDLRGPNGLHAFASLAGNGRSEDGSNKLPHTADVARHQVARRSDRPRRPNSLRSRQSRRQAWQAALRSATAVGCGRYKPEPVQRREQRAQPAPHRLRGSSTSSSSVFAKWGSPFFGAVR